MTDAEQQLQNAVTTTFLANLSFLSEYDNELYQRVDELSRMINNGTYIEKYTLEFIMENGDFDLYDKVNDKYLYKRNPKKINDDLVKQIQFDKKNSIFNIEEHFTRNKSFQVNIENKFELDNEIDCTITTNNDMHCYSNVLKDFLGNKKKRLKEIKKFIFLGTLLGRHIPRIAEKIDADIYLVVEKNLEIFRLSLFTVDYTILANKGVIFSIMDEEAQDKKIENFLDLGFIDNYLLKFSTTNINVDEYIDKILTYLISQKPTIYDYNRTLYLKINRTTKVLSHKYKTLKINEINDKCNFFEHRPILYIAAGPSLDENIEWIKKNENKFFIVTVGAAYKKLLLNDIKIDMITTLDEKNVLEQIQFDDESVNQIKSNTIILAGCSTSPKILEKLSNKNLFLFETQIPFIKENITFSGYSIGEVTLDILLKMNAKNIYLVGLDLALNQDTGSTHSTNSNSLLGVYDLNAEKSREFISLKEGVFSIDGNLRETVFTTPIFYISIKYLEYLTSGLSENIKIYNLSKHGAYFKNTIRTKIESLDIDTFSEIELVNEKLISFLLEHSSSSLLEESQQDVKNDIAFLTKFLNEDIKLIKKEEYKNYEEFSSKAFSLLSIVQEEKFSFIYLILNNYYKNIFPYLSYHFNDIKIKNETKKVKNIKEVFTLQIEDIIKDYISCLDRLLK